MDKEKALATVKNKAGLIKEEADELVKLAVEKGNNTIRKVTEEVRE